MGRRLNAKQKAFCRQYLACGEVGTEAAKRAGYQGSPNTLAVTACRLLRLAHIRTQIDVERAELSETMDASPAKFIRKLEELRDAAAEDKHHSSAAKLQELVGRVLGVFTPERRRDTPSLIQALQAVAVDVNVKVEGSGLSEYEVTQEEERMGTARKIEGDADYYDGRRNDRPDTPLKALPDPDAAEDTRDPALDVGALDYGRSGERLHQQRQHHWQSLMAKQAGPRPVKRM